MKTSHFGWQPVVNGMFVLRTERLILRRISTSDAEFILQLLNEPSFLRYIGDKHVRTADDARQYILSNPVASYEKNGFGLYLVSLKETLTPIGICGLIKRDLLEHPDIGFAFLPAYWSKGYGFESAAAVLTLARDVLNFTRVVAITDPDNEASIGLLERLGLRFERMIRFSEDEPEIKLFAKDL